MRSALIICAHDKRSVEIIRALESEHEIWNVARQRDAMAYLKLHCPDTVVLDMDMLGLNVEALLTVVRSLEKETKVLIIGVSKAPESIPESLACHLDQLAIHE